MSFLKKLFGGVRLDGMTLAQSQELKEMAQIDLLAQFDPPRPPHEAKDQARWSRALPAMPRPTDCRRARAFAWRTCSTRRRKILPPWAASTRC